MTDKTTVQTRGIGFLGWLTLIFIVLKLNPGSHLDTPIEDWSWWLVLLPFWGPIALALLLFVLGATGVGIAHFMDARDDKRRRKQRRDVQFMTPVERREYYQNLNNKKMKNRIKRTFNRN